MAKRHKPEEIIAKLRQVEVMTGQGTSMADAVRSIGVTEVTYYRWRSEYGGMKLDQVKRLKELEVENGRLRKAVSDLTLEKLILKEAAKENFYAPRAGGLASNRCGRSCRYRSAARVRRWGSIALRNARRHPASPTKARRPLTSRR